MKKFTDSEIGFLKENAFSFGAFVCSQKLGRKFSTVIARLRRDKIPYVYKKTNKTQKEIDLLQFVEKDKQIVYDFNVTEYPKELAYFIGFLWADGTINKNKYIVIEILKNDGESIKKIFSKVANFKIRYRKRENRQEQMSFFFSDENFVKFLNKNGKYSKTSESHEKILNCIPNEYKLYFIRGLIDGDGCFYGEKDKRNANRTMPQFSIASNYEQDWSALISYFKNFDIESTVSKRICRNGKYKSSCLRVTGTKNFKKLFNFLYENNDGIFLERKYDHCKEIINSIEYYREQIQENLPKYKVFKNGVYFDTINGTIKDFCKKNNFCYDNFCKLSKSKKSWRGYTVEKI